MISPARVEAVFRDCLFTVEEVAACQNDVSLLNMVEAEGIKTKVGFHPERLESYREEIIGWLMQMDDHFFMGKGEGWSFLNVCTDRDGNLWTGSHQVCDQLMQLGTGIGMVVLLVPRVHWSKMPGGVPYYAIKEAV